LPPQLYGLKHLILILFFCVPLTGAFGQADSTASITHTDSSSLFTGDTATGVIADTLKKDSVILKSFDALWREDSLYRKLLNNPYLLSKGDPVYLVVKERIAESKDEVFYLVAGLLAFLGFIKLIFPRYFANIFRLFFQPSFRQKQTREQLLQSNLPSLLLNLFFILSAGLYLALLVKYYQVIDISFWLLYLYAALLLLVLYAAKYLFITFSGWVFNVKEASETYLFVVYLINKIIGVILVPFTLVIAFSKSTVLPVAVTVSLLLVAMLFVYRYVVSFAPVRKEVKVSPLHFGFYVLAFEITPLLLIYKSLINYLHNTL